MVCFKCSTKLITPNYRIAKVATATGVLFLPMCISHG